MAEIVIMGELLVEIMRAEEDVQLYETGKYFRGPFPSGAPGIFVSTAAAGTSIRTFARFGHTSAQFLSVQQQGWDIAHQSFQE